MSCCQHREGLTLVEVMVAMAILGSTLAGFLAVFAMNQRTVLVANNQQRAMHQARGVVEELFSHSYDDAELAVGRHVVSGSCCYDVTEADRLKTLTVTLSWSNALQPRPTSFALTTAISQAIHR